MKENFETALQERLKNCDITNIRIKSIYDKLKTIQNQLFKYVELLDVEKISKILINNGLIDTSKGIGTYFKDFIIYENEPIFIEINFTNKEIKFVNGTIKHTALQSTVATISLNAKNNYINRQDNVEHLNTLIKFFNNISTDDIIEKIIEKINQQTTDIKNNINALLISYDIEPIGIEKSITDENLSDILNLLKQHNITNQNDAIMYKLKRRGTHIPITNENAKLGISIHDDFNTFVFSIMDIGDLEINMFNVVVIDLNQDSITLHEDLSLFELTHLAKLLVGKEQEIYEHCMVKINAHNDEITKTINQILTTCEMEI